MKRIFIDFVPHYLTVKFFLLKIVSSLLVLQLDVIKSTLSYEHTYTVLHEKSD